MWFREQSRKGRKIKPRFTIKLTGYLYRKLDIQSYRNSLIISKGKKAKVFIHYSVLHCSSHTHTQSIKSSSLLLSICLSAEQNPNGVPCCLIIKYRIHGVGVWEVNCTSLRKDTVRWYLHKDEQHLHRNCHCSCGWNKR